MMLWHWTVLQFMYLISLLSLSYTAAFFFSFAGMCFNPPAVASHPCGNIHSLSCINRVCSGLSLITEHIKKTQRRKRVLNESNFRGLSLQHLRALQDSSGCFHRDFSGLRKRDLFQTSLWCIRAWNSGNSACCSLLIMWNGDTKYKIDGEAGKMRMNVKSRLQGNIIDAVLLIVLIILQ